VKECTRDVAFEHFLTMHNTLVDDHLRYLASCKSREVTIYADLLSGVIEGHRQTLLALPDRYPGSGPTLLRLRSMR
jgi:hypothetical protein